MNHKKLKEKIDKLSKKEHINIYNLITTKQKNINISENNNGSFLNMNDLEENTLIELNNYIDYLDKQQEDINSVEDIKNEIKIKLKI
tara:strand:- start:471 stop:731 length:261 start_codon:yes stop_codon:yes gene_type:complete